MNHLLKFYLLVLFCSSALLRAQTPVITGPSLPGMERFDAAVTELMAKFNSPGAQLAVSFNGRLLLARGYGVADRETATPVQPDSLFRIASNTKPITAIAILALVEQGKLTLDTKVFPFLGLTPLPGATTLDARLQTITVQHLLNHTGGWDITISGDQTFNNTLIAAAAGVSAPADADAIIRYHLGRPLDFDPGSKYAYANFGYVVLGRVIEKASGQSYADYVHANIFAKAGITRPVLSRSLLQNRQLGEVRYYDYTGAPLVPSVFPPVSALVPYPYGGYSIESIFSTGGWAMSAVDYVRLLCALDGSKPGSGTILTPASINLWTEPPPAPVSAGATSYYAKGIQVTNVGNGVGTRARWFHNGGLPGNRSYMVRYPNNTTYAITFNTRIQDGPSMIPEIDATFLPLVSSYTPPAGDLFLTAKPVIVSAPSSQTVGVGTSATFSATFSSVTSPTYQWFKDGVAIVGATSATLTISNASATSAGNFHVVVTNAAGATSSTPATLSVGAVVNPGRLINLSILTSLAGGSDSFTMGYVVGGVGTAGAKPLVIRAAGPSLAQFGVGSPLADPKLGLYAGSTKTGENNDWGGGASVQAAMSAVGAFTLNSTDSLDAAVASDLPAGSNTVVVSSNNKGSGAVIAEIYDATPASSFTATTPRLINVSVLKPLGAGFTAGFVVGGSTSKQILVRAIGPTLSTTFGLAGAAADPQLTLFSGSRPIEQNDDWNGTAALTTAFGQVGAFNLPANSKDAALVARLAPGAYTAQVTSASGNSGLVIVEIYEVP